MQPRFPLLLALMAPVTMAPVTMALVMMALVMMGGCAARVSPGSPARPAAFDAPPSWSETLDEAVFGEPEAPAPASAPRHAVAEESRAASRVAAGRPQLAALKPAELALLAMESLQADRLDETARVLSVAVDVAPAPELPLFQRALGDALLGLGRPREAARLYRAAIAATPAAAPDSVPAPLYGNLAVAHYRLGEDAAARRAAERALELAPDYGEAMKTLGLLERRAGRALEAEAWLRKAVADNPALPEAQVALAEIEAENGRKAAAKERYSLLLAAFERERGRDFHRRWRNLFYPDETENELKKRLSRLD